MADGRPSGTSSARHLLELLVSFTEAEPEWTATELAPRLAISRAMTYRYLALLREFGLVESSGAGQYRLSYRAVALADAANAGRTRLVELAGPVMRSLGAATAETVLLTRRVGWLMYCVERVDSPQPIRLQLDRGRPLPLHSGSLARVHLAALSPSERAAYFAEVGVTERPPHLRDAALDEDARNGYAESQGEIDGSIWGFSVAVRQAGTVVAALGVTAPYHRNDPDQLDLIRRRVIEAGAELSRELGDEPPVPRA